MWLCVSLLCLLQSSSCWSVEELVFPPGFKFGAATAAYQTEGAWNVSDKGESIWDRFTHTNPGVIADHSNGDVACDSYHQWQRDIELAEELGLHYYRFSLSWSRLLPTGLPNIISEEGTNFYNNLIDGLLEKGIEPMVTLFHWDLPQRLQDLGGWTNPLMADWFAEYARVAFNLFGSKVRLWLTINEPLIICDCQYNMGIMAPGLMDPEYGAYVCSKVVLLAHAKAWRVYDREFRHLYHGEVSIANQMPWLEPKTEDDVELTELMQQYGAGKYSHPIYSKEGGWPPSLEKVMAENSRKRGYPFSTFPAFTQEEIELIRGTYDFYAMNHYTSRVVRKAKEGEKFSPWPMGDAVDLDAIVERRPDWDQAASSWLYINPKGIRQQLNWLRDQYGDLRFVITENGLATYGGLDDQDRVDYYRNYLEQVLLAIHVDRINVTHYTAWTLIDNFEWMDGYNVKYGLYEVDFSDPLRTRTPRSSAKFYKSVIQRHALPGKNIGIQHRQEFYLMPILTGILILRWIW